jgi:hypothetical protein
MKTGPSVVPGTYNITLKYLDQEWTKTVDVEEDPEVNLPLEERKSQHDALISIYKLNPVIAAVSQSLNSIQKDLGELKSHLKKLSDVPDIVNQKIFAITEKIAIILEKLNGNPKLGRQARYFSIRSLQRIARSIESYSEAPSEFQLKQIEEKSRELNTIIGQLNKIIEIDIPNLNSLLNEHEFPHIPLTAPIKICMN